MSSAKIEAPDPDASSAELQLEWDMWHKRVATVIFDRFNFFAKAAFKRSPPLLAEISYTVTRDGQIVDVALTKESSNTLFNVLVRQSVKSLNGDLTVLAFPKSSKRQNIRKRGTFTQNFDGCPGFKNIGDFDYTLHPRF